ncbi:MAG: hypothetical protein Q7J73_09420 [Dehalococcoidales bacterium]|nr:hypothetical protein [Dehalococcoidales bacterium]
MSRRVLQEVTFIVSLTVFLVIASSCLKSTNNPLPIPQNSSQNSTRNNTNILQICYNGTLVSNGIAVNDGSYVFTILNYVPADYVTTGMLSIASPQGNFSASVFTLDPRTGATLLKVKDHKLPPAKIIASSNIATGQAFIWGWYSSNGSSTLAKGAGNISVQPYGSPARFGVGLPDDVWRMRELNERSVVTDSAGNVLGLIGNEQFSMSYFSLPPPAGGQYWLVTAISGDVVELLLSLDMSKQPWAYGPVAFEYSEIGLGEGLFRRRWVSPPEYYNEIYAGLQALFKNVGPPFTPEESKSLLIGRLGKNFSVYYASPITLYSGSQAFAHARWINVEFDRPDGLPDNLVYGDSSSKPIGGLRITSDISYLKQQLR